MSTKTFNVSMPDELVKKIDQQSKLQGSNRSDFIRQAVRKQLDVLERWDAVAKAIRAEYKGPKLSEEEMANIVREYREEQPSQNARGTR